MCVHAKRVCNPGSAGWTRGGGGQHHTSPLPNHQLHHQPHTRSELIGHSAEQASVFDYLN